MNKALLPRLGAASGAVFAIVLFVAAGNGDGSFSGVRAVAGVVALTFAYPFVASLAGLLRAADGPHGWLAPAALGAGIAGITLKLASTVPELALHREHVADGTQLHRALQGMADGATLLCLYPLAAFCAVTAVGALRARVLPRWLGAGAALTATALVVNGAFLAASFVPALLLFLVWTLLTSIYLVRSASHESAPVREGATAAA